jgi:hypothetical protein
MEEKGSAPDGDNYVIVFPGFTTEHGPKHERSAGSTALIVYRRL